MAIEMSQGLSYYRFVCKDLEKGNSKIATTGTAMTNSVVLVARSRALWSRAVQHLADDLLKLSQHDIVEMDMPGRLFPTDGIPSKKFSRISLLVIEQGQEKYGDRLDIEGGMIESCGIAPDDGIMLRIFEQDIRKAVTPEKQDKVDALVVENVKPMQTLQHNLSGIVRKA
ncbi:hypothetical protein C8J56DRAFT_884463 [Mycena floridula]|nr:hypothetical protein C8J56DRAFT_884463 [Mycena floridula]